jgi:CHAT domain-containing protein
MKSQTQDLPAHCATVAQAEPESLVSLSEPQARAGASAEDLMRAGLRDYERGAFEQAASGWLAATRMYEEAQASAQQADALLRLAQAYTAMGHVARALSELERALVLVRASEDPVRIASVLAASGDTYLALGDTDRARERLGEAHALAAKTNAPGLQAMILNSQGNLSAAGGQHGEAAERYRQSAELAKAAGDPVLAARAAANEVRSSIQAGRYDGLAEKLAATLEQSLVLADSSQKARTLIHLGRSYQRYAERADELTGKTVLASARAFDAAAKVAGGVGDPRTASFALGYLGQLYERQGRRSEALELTRRALFAAQDANAPEVLYRWQWQLARLQAANLEIDPAIASYRATVRTLNRIRAETAIAEGESGGTFESSVAPIFFELVDLLLQRAASTEDSEARKGLLIEARNTVEDLKAAELRDYFQDECVDAQRKAAPDLIPETVVIYPIILRDRAELIVSLPEGLERFVVPASSQELSEEVRGFRGYLEKRTTREYRPHAEKLYDWLIRPLEGALASNQVRTLVFVPGGVLRTIPMAALYDRETKQFLVEKYPLAITPGLTLTDPRKIDRENVQLLTAGLTESVQGYPPLPHVASEVEAVQSVFGGKALMNAAFVVPAVEEGLSERQVGIVHIASHGEFRAESAESFLLTYDGRLAVDRLSELVGTTQFREQPLELLTLSACETAAGDERAALGLAGVAVQAGARSVLATLWSVSDPASAELITEFYRQLGESGVSRAEALQRAQLALIKSRRYRHPGYWSPFLLISNWL